MVLKVSLCQGCQADAAEMDVEPQYVNHEIVIQTNITAYEVPTVRQDIPVQREAEHSKSKEGPCNHEPHPRTTEKDPAHPGKSQPSEVPALQRMPVSSLQTPESHTSRNHPVWEPMELSGGSTQYPSSSLYGFE